MRKAKKQILQFMNCIHVDIMSQPDIYKNTLSVQPFSSNLPLLFPSLLSESMSVWLYLITCLPSTYYKKTTVCLNLNLTVNGALTS